jgi:hypothetical protein
MALKQRDKDAEIEVLKEMIKGIKVQVKCNFSYTPKQVTFDIEQHKIESLKNILPREFVLE